MHKPVDLIKSISGCVLLFSQPGPQVTSSNQLWSPQVCWSNIFSLPALICNQGSANQDPPDQNQDEALSGANNSQNTPPIPVPAIVKVSVCFHLPLLSGVDTLLGLIMCSTYLALFPLNSQRHQTKTDTRNPKM